MVQPAQDRLRDYVSKPLDRPRAGRILPQRNMGSRLIVVRRIFRKNAPKVLGVEHNHMVQALAPDRPDQALNMPVLPGRPERCGSIPDTHRSDASLEHGAERSVIVANEIFRRRLPRKRLRDLPRQPLGCRITGHRKPQQLPAFVAKNKKCKKLRKRNGRTQTDQSTQSPPHDCE